jgi:hypothetical protein
VTPDPIDQLQLKSLSIMLRSTRFLSSTGALAATWLAATLLSTGALAVDETNFRFDTTEDLYQVCSAEGSGEGVAEARLACRAFIEATVQYHDAVSDRKKLKRLICYPGTATIEDGRQAFVAWGAKNQGNGERMKELPVVGLVRALAEAYPCK